MFSNAKSQNLIQTFIICDLQHIKKRKILRLCDKINNNKPVG